MTGADPIGTAGTYDGFVVVEYPLPWPRDVGQMPELVRLSDLAKGTRLRLQVVVPQAHAGVVVYMRSRRDSSGFRSFDRYQFAGVADAELFLCSATATSLESQDAARDVLVCSHGRRDICCGSTGTALVNALTRSALPDGVVVWRTSHTGGHRFAPTFVVLPEGTMWGFADVDLIRRVLNRDGEISEVLDKYRGCVGLPTARVQALEREVLRREGWRVLDGHRRGRDDGGPAVELDVVATDGAVVTWTAVVEPSHSVLVPECGRPIAEAKKEEFEWSVRELSKTS